MPVTRKESAPHPADGSIITIKGELETSLQIDSNFGFIFGLDKRPRCILATLADDADEN